MKNFLACPSERVIIALFAQHLVWARDGAEPTPWPWRRSPSAFCLLPMPPLGQKPCLCSWPAGAADTQCRHVFLVPGDSPRWCLLFAVVKKDCQWEDPKTQSRGGPGDGEDRQPIGQFAPSAPFRCTRARVPCVGDVAACGLLCHVCSRALGRVWWGGILQRAPLRWRSFLRFCFFVCSFFGHCFYNKRAQLYCTLTAARVTAFPVFSFVCWDPNLSNMFGDLSGRRVGHGWINTFRKCWVASWGTFNMSVFVAITGSSGSSRGHMSDRACGSVTRYTLHLT